MSGTHTERWYVRTWLGRGLLVIESAGPRGVWRDAFAFDGADGWLRFLGLR
jgi:hypothetical protein